MYYDTMIYNGRELTKEQFEKISRDMTFRYVNRFDEIEVVNRIGKDSISCTTYTKDGDQIGHHIFSNEKNKEMMASILSDLMEVFDEREYTEDDSIGYLYTWE